MDGRDVGLAGRALGLLIGGTLALAGLVALFVAMMNLSVGNLGTGVTAGAFTVALGGYGADRIFRAVNGSAAVDAFRAAVGLVFSLALFAAIVWNGFMVAAGRIEAPGPLALVLGLSVLPVSAAAAYRCGKSIGLVGSSARHNAPAA